MLGFDRQTGLGQVELGNELLAQANAELARLRVTRGAARRLRRAIAMLALASSLLGLSTEASAGEASHTILTGRLAGPPAGVRELVRSRPMLASIDVLESCSRSPSGPGIGFDRHA